MKNLILFILGTLMLSSCADNYTFKKDGVEVVATPYGWLNKEDKIPGVVYQINVGNLVWDALLCETIVVPIVLTGFELYEPVNYIEK